MIDILSGASTTTIFIVSIVIYIDRTCKIEEKHSVHSEGVKGSGTTINLYDTSLPEPWVSSAMNLTELPLGVAIRRLTCLKEKPERI